MHRLIFLALFLSANLSYLRADDGDDKFYILAQGCVYKNGSLEIDPYVDSILWLNGIRQRTNEDMLGPITLKSGDVLITGSPLVPYYSSDFYRYRLDKLTDQRAYFTLSIYDAVIESFGSNGHRYRLGGLKSTCSFQLDLSKPHFCIVDFGPNHLELSWQKSARGK